MFTDNARIPLDGRTARVMAGRPDAITESRDKHGAFHRFEVRDGDCCRDDKGRTPQPKRAFLTIESMGNVPRWGKKIIHDFTVVIEPGPTILEGGAHVTLCQENVYPEDGKNWQSPVMEFGLVAIGRTMKRGDGKVVGVKNPDTGRPFVDEYGELVARAMGSNGRGEVVARILTKKPVVRGEFNRFRLVYVDSQGEPGGLLKMTMNGGKVQGEYRGPTGYKGFRSPYPAFGVYAHNGQVSPIAARFYGWRETPVA